MAFVLKQTDKDVRDLVSDMELYDVVIYTGPKKFLTVQMQISTLQSRLVLKGRRRTFVDDGRLFIVRVE